MIARNGRTMLLISRVLAASMIIAIGAIRSARAQDEVYTTGYVADDPAALDTVSHYPRVRAFLPVSKDLSAGFPPPPLPSGVTLAAAAPLWGAAFVSPLPPVGRSPSRP